MGWREEEYWKVKEEIRRTGLKKGMNHGMRGRGE
jgi:hypothetical protein